MKRTIWSLHIRPIK